MQTITYIVPDLECEEGVLVGEFGGEHACPLGSGLCKGVSTGVSINKDLHLIVTADLQLVLPGPCK